MSTERYHITLRLIHWLMALMILGLIATGWYMEGLDSKAPDKYDLYPWHKSFGVLVLLLVTLRIGVRLWTFIPSLPETMRAIERHAAHGAHLLLYVFMVGVPLTGYTMSMAGGYGVKLFGLKLPNWIGEDKALAGLAHELHGILPYVMLGIIVLHVAGALKHRFFDVPEHNVLRRMGF